MPSPDLPQPIYPNAPVPPQPQQQPQPQYGYQGGYPQQPQQQAPGSWNQPPQHHPTPPAGQPGGNGRRTQILLAVGAVAVIAVVVLVIVLVTRSGGGTTAGGTTTAPVGGGGQQTVDTGGNQGNGGQGTLPDADQIRAELAQVAGSGFSAGSIDCMAQAIAADPAIYAALSGAVMSQADAASFAGIVVPCTTVDERVNSASGVLAQQYDEATVSCAIDTMYTWGDSQWVGYLAGMAVAETQAATLTSYFPTC